MSKASGRVTLAGLPLGGGRGQLERIRTMIDPAFLVEVGWDPDGLVLAPPDGHRLLVRPVCRVEGCSTTATGRRRLCKACERRLSDAGLDDDQVELLASARPPRRVPERCLVAGCRRERTSGPAGLCRVHADQHDALGVSKEAFLVHPAVMALGPSSPCGVAACPRQRRHPDGAYCDAHQQRLRAARRRDPGLDEARWRRVEPAVRVGGQVSLRGLGPLVVAEVLYGLQQRCRLERVQTKEADVRAVCDDLRRQQVDGVADYVLGDRRDLGFVGLVRSVVAHARRALATPETEVVGDEWDLAVFGHSGTVMFTAISQRWLREATKRWAADDLPRRRVRAGRRTSGGLAVRHHVNCVTMLSESLRALPDRASTRRRSGGRTWRRS
ncbi:MAG: hypothetical protein LC733_03835 [Actinobacteria bacterium]|nr:hypothetical protein [Actinomycetota bacterium]